MALDLLDDQLGNLCLTKLLHRQGFCPTWGSSRRQSCHSCRRSWALLLPAQASCCLHSIQFGFLGACPVSLNQHSCDCIMRSHPKPYPTKPFLLSSIQAKQKAKDMFKGKRNDEPNVCVAGEKCTVLTLASL